MRKTEPAVEEMLATMRRRTIERGELTRSRYQWELLLADYGLPATESEAVRIIELALRATDSKSPTIAFAPGVIEEVHDRLDALVRR